MKARLMFVMLAGLLAVCIVASLAPTEGTAGQGGVTISVDEIGPHKLVLAFGGLPNAGGTLDVVVQDLDGKVLGQASARIIGNAAAVTVPATIDKNKLPEYVVLYRAAVEDDYVRRSLFHLLDRLETIVVGQREYYSGSTASLRVVARNRSKEKAIEGADVTIELTIGSGKPAVLFNGKTNAAGTVQASMDFPADAAGTGTLKVTVSCGFDKDEVSQVINIKSSRKILVTTDKPMYQPGQTIHMRLLTLSMPGSRPAANTETTIEVADSKGNRVYKKVLKTNEFGIASGEFRLAHELNKGRYTVRALVGNAQQEKTITVERYVLPKFKVVLKTERSFYAPGETVTGDIQADYFFGKPVSKGEVKIKFSKFDTGFEEFAELTGTLDENGHYSFTQKLPDYFVGQPLEQGKAFAKIDIEVVDGAEHKETATRNVTVATSPIIVVAVPEGGRLIPAIENEVYFVTTYADGRPAETKLTVAGASAKNVSLNTDAGGFATMKFTPGEKPVELEVSGSDAQGNRFSQTLSLDVNKQGADSLLLRCGKALYTVGDDVHLSVISTRKKGTVYFDVVQANQTVLTDAVELTDGKASRQLNLTESLAGTVAVRAYIIGGDGNIVRDTRMLYVDPASDLTIRIETDKSTYLPADYAHVRFTVTDKDNHPVLAALGVMVVDEAVFALQEMQPGMEKVYFYLEKELMKPRYEIHGYDVDSLVMPRPLIEKERPGLLGEARREMAGKVLLAAAEGTVATDLTINTYNDQGKALEYQQYIAKRLKKRHDKITTALNRFSRRVSQGKGDAKTKIEWDRKKPVPLDILVDKGLLKRSDILDPWGNEFTIEGHWCQGCINYHGFALISNGPDGVVATADDIGLPYNMVKTRGRPRFKGGMAKPNRGGIMLEAARDMAGAAPRDEDMKGDGSAGAGAPGAGAAPRIRKFFPETLYFNPLVITDKNGRADLEIKLADSITTWRLTSMASSLKGELGSMTGGLRVFQQFFIDIDFPVSLYQHDEVSVPIALYNYLDTEQQIRLKVEQGDWFRMLDPAEKTVTIGPNDVRVEYFTIQVERIGNHRFTVYGYGSDKSDAISREIEVVPDGAECIVNETGRLEGKVEKTIAIPPEAIDDASTIFVKIYPGVFAQAIEGMDQILRMPSGCFEQTSSATYPNILVLDYMKATGKITPEVQMKAESFINTGYQRLLSYEVDGGGFEWFGKAPAHNILPAYGLMEFYDMSKVHDVDPNVIARTQQWLVAQQQENGSWKPTEGGIAEGAINKYRNDVLRSTAYILWALVHSDYRSTGVAKAVKYIEDHLDEATDTYTLAVLANAFIRYDKNHPVGQKVLATLLNQKVEDGESIYWKMTAKTPTYGSGETANIEVTGLVCQALVRSGKHAAIISKVNNYLVEKKDSYGTWQSTQATIQALRAMLMSTTAGTEQVVGKITVAINGTKSIELSIDETNNEVLQIVDLKGSTTEGENIVTLDIKGEGSMFYQIVGRYYLPHAKAGHIDEPMTIDVKYDKTTLAKDDTVTVDVSVTNNRPMTAKMLIVDLGTPPGFDLVTSDFGAMVEAKTIEKFSKTGRQIIVYLREIKGNETLKLQYHLVAKYPMKAKTTASSVYEYYSPGIRAESQPQEIIVTKK